MREYSQGVCHDGVAILCDGVPMTPDNIVHRLRGFEAALTAISDMGEGYDAAMVQVADDALESA